MKIKYKKLELLTGSLEDFELFVSEIESTLALMDGSSSPLVIEQCQIKMVLLNKCIADIIYSVEYPFSYQRNLIS